METDSFKDLLVRNINADLQLLSRAGGLLRAMGRMASESGRPNLEDFGNVASDWLKLNLAFYARISDQSVQYLNAAMSLAEDALRVRPARVPPTKASMRPEIRVQGRIGDMVTSPFQVQNIQPQVTNVSFEAEDFVASGGDRVGAQCVRFDPTATSLEPNEQRVIRATVQITPDFKVGETYFSTIRVVGFAAKEMALVLDILPASAHS